MSDVVSAADHAAEELIVARLRTERPGDGVVGEEGTNEPSTRTWFIDPVDGTYNFLSGLSFWCSALALTDGDGPVLGAVYHPSNDELWLGGRDQPTTRNGEPVARLADQALSQVSVASYLHPDTIPDDAVRLPLLRALRDAATVRMFGSGSIELASVAAGRLGGWVQYDCYDWDWLPGAAQRFGNTKTFGVLRGEFTIMTGLTWLLSKKAICPRCGALWAGRPRSSPSTGTAGTSPARARSWTRSARC